jgi:hypothetical protein
MSTSPAPKADRFEWCEIRRWRGYATSSFYAVTETGEVLAESAAFRWRKSAPPPQTPAARAAYDEVVAAVTAAGWKSADEPDGSWYAMRFSRQARAPVVPAVPVAPPVVEAAPAVPVAPPPVERPRAPETPVPQAAQPVAPPPPPPSPPVAAAPVRRRRARLAVAGGAGALAVVAAAVLPGTLRGTPHPPAAAPTTKPKPGVVAKTHSKPRHSTPAPPAVVHRQALVDLRIVAHGNGSWMEVRRRSATGPVLYRQTLAPGKRLHLRAPRLWVRFGAAGNLSITDNGRPVELSGTEAKLFVP